MVVWNNASLPIPTLNGVSKRSVSWYLLLHGQQSATVVVGPGLGVADRDPPETATPVQPDAHDIAGRGPQHQDVQPRGFAPTVPGDGELASRGPALVAHNEGAFLGATVLVDTHPVPQRRLHAVLQQPGADALHGNVGEDPVATLAGCPEHLAHEEVRQAEPVQRVGAQQPLDRGAGERVFLVNRVVQAVEGLA